uniref:Putative secreted protein n=1 Tax=Ixodes ricinus TaxID=34613 RepID=A0A147BDH4_IXORI
MLIRTPCICTSLATSVHFFAVLVYWVVAVAQREDSASAWPTNNEPIVESRPRRDLPVSHRNRSSAAREVDPKVSNLLVTREDDVPSCRPSSLLVPRSHEKISAARRANSHTKHFKIFMFSKYHNVAFVYGRLVHDSWAICHE